MKTVKLDNPVTENGTEVSEIILRPITVGDILVTEKRGNSDLDKEIILISNLASVSRETIEKLHLKDYTKVQEELKDFFPSVT